MIPLSIKFFGVKVSLITREELNEYLIHSIYENSVFRIIFLDEKKLFLSLFNKEFRELLLNTEVVICTSITIRWIIKFLTKKEIPIMMPVTVFLDFMRVTDDMNYTVYLFGGSKKVANENYKRIRRSFPKTRIVGYYKSKVKSKELNNVLVNIRKSSPQLLFVNLGGGWKQEKWISNSKEYYKNSIVVGVDKSFEIIAGKRKMPPLWFQEKNLNGLFYSLSKPYNIFRFFRIIVLFVVALIKKIRKET